jgi:hypothetical protein
LITRDGSIWWREQIDLGIAPTRLNRVRHEVLGRSAAGTINARLRLEAERDPV